MGTSLPVRPPRGEEGGYTMLKRRLRNQKGVSAVEFALVLPVLLLFLGGTIDFGIIFFVNHMTGNAAREGARLAASQRGLASGSINDADVDQRIKRFLPISGLFKDVGHSATATIAPPDCEVEVEVTGQVPYFFLSIFETMTGDSFPINRTVTMRYEHCSQPAQQGAIDEVVSLVFMAPQPRQKQRSSGDHGGDIVVCPRGLFRCVH